MSPLERLCCCRNFTLATFPFFIDQTIGGAIATGCHGSSTRYGSLSGLVKVSAYDQA
jgi:FAD/FMN-containing dehydrogenase